MSWQSIYFKYGLHWNHRYVPLTNLLKLKTIIIGALCWWYLSTLPLHAEISKLELKKSLEAQQLIDCMNGRAIWTAPTSKKNNGYSLEVHKCKGIEVFEI